MPSVEAKQFGNTAKAKKMRRMISMRACGTSLPVCSVLR